MVQRKSDYDSTVAYGEGFKKLPKGGYVCKIIKAMEEKSKNGKDMIHFAFDIAEGDYQNYFKDLFNKRKERSDDPLNVKYPFEGQMWVLTDDYEDPTKTSRKFKALCTALSDSGTKVWSDDGVFLINNLVGATLGIVFQDQEQEYNGKASWRAIPYNCRSVESIHSGDFFIPEDKALSVEEVAKSEFGFAAMDNDADDIPF